LMWAPLPGSRMETSRYNSISACSILFQLLPSSFLLHYILTCKSFPAIMLCGR
jgi:hypothetical protein